MPDIKVAGMKISRLAPWFGADTAVAERAAVLIGRRNWIGIPFCGGCSIIPHLRTREGLCGDKHRHIINLATVIADPRTRADLVARLDGLLFHPDVFKAAQIRCIERQRERGGMLFGSPDSGDNEDPVGWAADYFVSAWMGRGGHSGKKSEFTQGLSVRFTASGGGSARRFRSAVESLQGWGAALTDWQFECGDAFHFLARVRDEPGHALYVDPPWPKLGDEYAHDFTAKDHARLNEVLQGFRHIRIVVRYGIDDVISNLYGSGCWEWHLYDTRNQQNNQVSEALIVKGGE